MAKYSCVYSAADGKLLEIGPAGTVWFRSTDPKEADKFKVVDGVTLSDAAASTMKLIALGGGGDGADKTALQLVEAPAILSAAQAKAIIDASIAEILAVKPKVEAIGD